MPHADVVRVVWKCIVGVGVVMVATIVALALYTFRVAFFLSSPLLHRFLCVDCHAILDACLSYAFKEGA